jgi:hypothetical protein
MAHVAESSRLGRTKQPIAAMKRAIRATIA